MLQIYSKNETNDQRTDRVKCSESQCALHCRPRDATVSLAYRPIVTKQLSILLTPIHLLALDRYLLGISRKRWTTKNISTLVKHMRTVFENSVEGHSSSKHSFATHYTIINTYLLLNIVYFHTIRLLFLYTVGVPVTSNQNI